MRTTKPFMSVNHGGFAYNLGRRRKHRTMLRSPL
jgi:hypothetical protein